MLTLQADQIKGVFVLADLFYRELGYSVENLFGDDYVGRRSWRAGDDVIVLEVRKSKFCSENSWTVELLREEESYSGDVFRGNYIEELVVALNDYSVASNEFVLKVFRSEKNGKWTATLDYEIDEVDFDSDYYEISYDKQVELEFEESCDQDSEPPEKAESSSLESALSRLENIIESKLNDN